jgi:hypothetical protein
VALRPALVHHRLGEKPTDNLEELIIVGGKTMVIILDALNAPAGCVKVEIDKRIAGGARLARMHIGLFTLLLLIGNALQIESVVSVSGLDLIEVQISYLVSLQKEIMLILTHKFN